MFAMALLALLSPGTVQPAQAASYDEAVRCAGLTQAASELEGGESGEGRSLYDAALYWSLTAMQMAQAADRPAATAETDQSRAYPRCARAQCAGRRGARRAATLPGTHPGSGVRFRPNPGRGVAFAS